jgi:hypothetical protein
VGEKTELRVRVDAEGADVEEVAELTRRQLRRALLELDVDAAEPVPGGQAPPDTKAVEALPDDHPAREGDHLGRAPRRQPLFADAGFTEVGRPTLRRVVMRIDF